MDAEPLPCTVRLPSSVLIARVVFFLLERDAQTHRQNHTQTVTDATDHVTHATATADLGDNTTATRNDTYSLIEMQSRAGATAAAHDACYCPPADSYVRLSPFHKYHEILSDLLPSDLVLLARLAAVMSRV